MKIISATMLSIVLSGFLYAQEKGLSGAEKGSMYGATKENNETDMTKKTQKDLLLELVKLNRKQLKEQTRIREILENEFDPKPKMMTLKDGTKCIENSSAKCFKMPMVNEVKRIPAYVNFYQKRDLESAKVKEMWEGTYVKEILKTAYLKSQAIRELGPKYPLSTSSVGTLNNIGYSSVAKKRFRKELVKKHSDKFDFIVLIGMNQGLDMFALTRAVYLKKKAPFLNITYVFKDEASQQKWVRNMNVLPSGKNMDANDFVVQPELFTELKPYTTPAVYMRDKTKNKNILAFIGRYGRLDLYRTMIEYLLNENIIERNQLSGYNLWNSDAGESVVSDYFEDTIGVKYEK